jgi:glycosyltransferase involved in cell wall biosynthesis
LVADLARVQAESSKARVGVLVCGTPPGHPSLARYEAPGVTVTAAGLLSGFDMTREPLALIAATLAKFDVTHMHGFTPSVARAARRAGRPIVFTEHGLLGLGAKKLSPAAAKQSLKGAFLRREVSAVACVSGWVAETAQRKYRIEADRLHTVPDGADLDSVRARRDRGRVLRDEGLDPGAWVSVVTARLVHFKRIDRLISAAGLLPPDPRSWAVLIAGSGPEGERLREHSATLHLEDHLRLLGYRDNVWDLVGAADLVVVPSENEPFGLVVIEAMALGRPVVAFSDSGGPAEILLEVGGGCLVESVEALATVMEHSRRDSPLPGFHPLDRNKLEGTYSIKRTAATYAQLYSAAVGSG